jgi:hypothetical protein
MHGPAHPAQSTTRTGPEAAPGRFSVVQVIGTALFGKDVVVLVVTLLPLYGPSGNCVRDGVQFCLFRSLDGVGVVLFSRGVRGIRLVGHCFLLHWSQCIRHARDRVGKIFCEVAESTRHHQCGDPGLWEKHRSVSRNPDRRRRGFDTTLLHVTKRSLLSSSCVWFRWGAKHPACCRFRDGIGFSQ